MTYNLYVCTVHNCSASLLAAFSHVNLLRCQWLSYIYPCYPKQQAPSGPIMAGGVDVSGAVVQGVSGLMSALDLFEKCRPHPTALYQLAHAYHKGAPLNGTPRLRVDPRRAFELYTEACEGVGTYTREQLNSANLEPMHNTSTGIDLTLASSVHARIGVACLWCEGKGVPDLELTRRKAKARPKAKQKDKLRKKEAALLKVGIGRVLFKTNVQHI
jgi:hypothetical protein